jgi:HK97 family phage portal protein
MWTEQAVRWLPMDADLIPHIWGWGREAKSGVTVSWSTALEVTTVFACLQVLANGVSQVPLKLYRPKDGGGSTPAVDHPLYRVLYRRPNRWQTSFEFRQTLVFHRGLCGNFYAFKNVVGGEIKELIPLTSRVAVKRNRDLSLTYAVTAEDGSQMEFPQEAIWHLRGPSWNSWTGMEAVKLAREAIGLAIATEDAHSRLHRNGGKPGGLYSVVGKLGEDQYKKLSAWIEDKIGGPNAGKDLILDSDAKYTPTAMKGVDMQHLETRRFQIEEICRSFNVKPIMIGHADKTQTYASAEQMFLAHVVHTLSPWYEDLEQSIDVNLLPDDEDIFAKFTVNALLRGASADRAAFYSKALGAGGSPAWMTQDEVRGLEDLNPMGGDAAALPKPTNVAPAVDPAKDPTPAKDDGNGPV